MVVFIARAMVVFLASLSYPFPSDPCSQPGSHPGFFILFLSSNFFLSQLAYKVMDFIMAFLDMYKTQFIFVFLLFSQSPFLKQSLFCFHVTRMQTWVSVAKLRFCIERETYLGCVHSRSTPLDLSPLLPLFLVHAHVRVHVLNLGSAYERKMQYLAEFGFLH